MRHLYTLGVLAWRLFCIVVFFGVVGVLAGCQPKASTEIKGSEVTSYRLDAKTTKSPASDSPDSVKQIKRWRVVPRYVPERQSMSPEATVLLAVYASAIAAQPIERTFASPQEAMEYQRELAEQGYESEVSLEVLTGKGSDITTSAGEVALAHDASAPAVTGSMGQSARGSASKTAAELVTPSTGMAVFFVLGSLALVGGLAVFFGAPAFKRLGLGAAIGGGVLIGIGILGATYPWVFAIGGLVVLGGLVWIVYDYRKGSKAVERQPDLERRAKVAARTVETVNDLSEPAKAEFKAKASEIMDRDDKTVVKTIKAGD